ncbi:phage major capsid protein [Modestobacter muralis]|uniref:Phage major capsid protein n=1 Tax=Modestobacter muralis TaxID=1608614 RepID=A0A6P0H5D1_9ACTN|nr:phage major capsid protein [Modestobacter muralis]NEN51038.1 phage major capsid protein [Modestobacter muralis]
MSTTTATAPELTREQVLAILVQPLEAVSVFLASGPRIFDTAGPLRIPKLGGPTADPGWTGESEPIPERDVDFDEVKLMPSTMKSVKVITKFSNELARQSVVALDATLRDRLVRDVAAKIDTQFLSASGDGVTTPRGLFAWPGTQTLAVDGALSLDDLHDADGLVLGADVDPTKVRWFMTSREFIGLRKQKDSSGKYLIQPDPTQAGAYQLLGHGVTITNRIPDTTGTATGRVALADMSQVAVARDLAPSVKILDQTFAGTDEMGLRVVARYDVAPLNAKAVVKLTGITV